jgi:hypothetical protein
MVQVDGAPTCNLADSNEARNLTTFNINCKGTTPIKSIILHKMKATDSSPETAGQIIQIVDDENPRIVTGPSIGVTSKLAGINIIPICQKYDSCIGSTADWEARTTANVSENHRLKPFELAQMSKTNGFEIKTIPVVAA